ncbi:MAG TPA: hypothetical protein VL175_21855 [Pirellulales bacterium]|jgi:hypothetical protein|nr:hypothetical protein [Pirellulales bacterium]HTM56693.1 hypothetical protein [Pirellulales bacterium]
MNKYEPFSDVPEYERTPEGIFGGDAGLKHFNSVPTRLVAEGLAVRFTCLCGNSNSVTTTWPELVLIAQQRIPQGWRYDERGVAQPLVPCRACGRAVGFGLTPDECKRTIEQGIAAQYISAAQVQAIAQAVGSVRR